MGRGQGDTEIPIPTQALANQACPTQRTGVWQERAPGQMCTPGWDVQVRCLGMLTYGWWHFWWCSQSWCDVGRKRSCDLSQCGLLRPASGQLCCPRASPHHRRVHRAAPDLGSNFGQFLHGQSAQLRARAQFLPSMMKELLPGQTWSPRCHPAFPLSSLVPNSLFLIASFLWIKNLLFNIATVIIKLKPSFFQLHSRYRNWQLTWFGCELIHLISRCP